MRPLVFLAALLIGCAGAAHDDGLRSRIAAGCQTEAECSAFYQEADARARACLVARKESCSDAIDTRERAQLLLNTHRNAPPAPRAEPAAPPAPTVDPNADHERDCASDRAVRVAHMQQRIAAVDDVDKLRDWERAHCKWIDNSQPVVRSYVDGNGWIHDRVEADRGVDRVCNAKKPPRLEHAYSDHLVPAFTVDPDEGRRDLACADADASDPTAAAFWAEWSYHRPWTVQR